MVEFWCFQRGWVGDGGWQRGAHTDTVVMVETNVDEHGKRSNVIEGVRGVCTDDTSLQMYTYVRKKDRGSLQTAWFYGVRKRGVLDGIV